MTETITSLLSTLWDVWKEMFSMFFSVVKKVVHVAVWALVGVLILPCVFVAGHLYPLWIEWGEDF